MPPTHTPKYNGHQRKDGNRADDQNQETASPHQGQTPRWSRAHRHMPPTKHLSNNNLRICHVQLAHKTRRLVQNGVNIIENSQDEERPQVQRQSTQQPKPQGVVQGLIQHYEAYGSSESYECPRRAEYKHCNNYYQEYSQHNRIYHDLNQSAKAQDEPEAAIRETRATNEFHYHPTRFADDLFECLDKGIGTQNTPRWCYFRPGTHSVPVTKETGGRNQDVEHVHKLLDGEPMAENTHCMGNESSQDRDTHGLTTTREDLSMPGEPGDEMDDFLDEVAFAQLDSRGLNERVRLRKVYGGK